jgi:heat shock protein HtpX
MAIFRTTILLATLTAMFLAIGYLIAGTGGMTIALVFALLINFISYWFSDKIVLSMYGARPYDSREINSMVEKLSNAAGIPKPDVYIVESKIANAFATGRGPGHAALAVTRGLAENLTRDEMEGVIAHEISHIKNRDVLVSTMAATIAGAISYIAQMAYWGALGSDSRERGGALVLIPLIILAPIAAMLVQLAISRGREYGADYTGAMISKKPKALASALEKISYIAKAHPVRGNNATSHMWIVNPFSGNALMNLFSTHPPIEERIERLRKIKV